MHITTPFILYVSLCGLTMPSPSDMINTPITVSDRPPVAPAHGKPTTLSNVQTDGRCVITSKEEKEVTELAEKTEYVFQVRFLMDLNYF